ncbi:hypothetical protein HK413_11705 [Mucilaginibacter sp. S1162]|uniref:Tox-MPTase3 domain-containing protein n=1 Tax=Mucilaginibacter humi TaxID=2732510 RepID=A0ABX1W4I0_9SPHI|nr:hypothetical protein [Mucilaginibacter humi]NNU34581.1 hypothetical protein [Mucilaginibacter humi]
MKNQVDSVLAKGLNSFTSILIRLVFLRSANFNIDFSQNGMATTKDADTYIQISNNNTFKSFITLNSNVLPTASKEYIASTIIHELTHTGWLLPDQKPV